jgi:excisionase family DNA binding protein
VETVQQLNQTTEQTFTPGQPEWLTAAEAAAYLRVKTRTLLEWARQGKIKGYQLSGVKRHVWRFRRDDLDTALLGSPVLGFVPASVPQEGTMIQ